MNWLKSFNKSEENKLRSFNTYYSHDVLGETKQFNFEKANKQAMFQGHSVPNSISYKELIINTVDIRTVKNLSDLCRGYKKLLVYIGSLLNSF